MNMLSGFFQAMASASPMSVWHAALGNAGSAQARVMYIADSILEGTGASTRAKRSVDLMLAELIATHPVSGQGASRYLPAHFGMPSTITPWAPTWHNSQSGTITDYNGNVHGGSGTKTNTFGLGLRSTNFAAGAIRTYTVTGTDVDIWTCAGGSFQYKIDGGSYGSTVITSGQNANGDVTQVSLGTTGSHTIAIKCITATLHFLGFTIYDGGRSNGIASFEASHYGAVIPDFYDVGTPSAVQNAKFLRGLVLVDPHLVIVNVGANDAQIYTPAQLQTNLTGLLNVIKSTLPSASVLYVQTYDQVSGGTTVGGGSTVAEYVAVLQPACDAASVPLFKLSPPMTAVYNDTTGLYQADGLHLTDAGHMLLAETLEQNINPAYVPPVRIGASTSTNTGTTASITTQASGSALYAVTSDAIGSAASLTLTDNKGNTFTQVDSLAYGGAYSTAFWKCENAVGGAGHSFYHSTAGGRAAASVVEILGVPVSDTIRANTSTTTFGSGPWSSGTVSAVAGDLILGLTGYDYTTNPTQAVAGIGFNLLTESKTNTYMHTAIERQTAASSGSVDASFNATPSGAGAFVFVAAIKGS